MSSRGTLNFGWRKPIPKGQRDGRIRIFERMGNGSSA
jgi:hypothetical protein